MNSVEQGIIFFPLFAYFTLYHSDEERKMINLMIGLKFILGRILFALGYLAINFGYSTFRAAGFALTYYSSILSLLFIYDIDLPKIIISL